MLQNFCHFDLGEIETVQISRTAVSINRCFNYNRSKHLNGMKMATIFFVENAILFDRQSSIEAHNFCNEYVSKILRRLTFVDAKCQIKISRRDSVVNEVGHMSLLPWFGAHLKCTARFHFIDFFYTN